MKKSKEKAYFKEGAEEKYWFDANCLGLYIVGIVIMGAVVFYVGKQVLEILSQPVAKIIVGAICAFIVFGTIKELQVGFSWSNIALLAGAIVGIVIILKSLKK